MPIFRMTVVAPGASDVAKAVSRGWVDRPQAERPDKDSHLRCWVSIRSTQPTR